MSLDRFGENMGRGLANRFTRRSFLARVGTGSLVAASGVSATALLTPAQKAFASHGCPGCSNCGYSVQCESFGATGDNCPGGSCGCGNWMQCAGCNGKYKKFKDCCGDCGQGCRCKDGWPTCCYSAPYGSCNGHGHVKCRQIFCTNTAC